MALVFFLFSQILIGILIGKAACYVYCISESILINDFSIFGLYVKDSHKKLWNIQILCLGLEGSVIFADNFSGSYKPFLFEMFFWSLFFLNIDQAQAVFLFSFVVQIVLKLQIFCADPRFLFSFGCCPLVQNPNLYILYPFLALNPTYYLIASFGNWLHILDFLQYVVWN